MLYQLFQSVQSEEAFEQLLSLTFTDHERAMMLERWRIFDALDQGLTQRKVAEVVPCSVVTATRGAKEYRKNKELVQHFLKVLRANGASKQDSSS